MLVGTKILLFSPGLGLDPSDAAFATGSVFRPRTPTAVHHFSVMIEIRYSEFVKMTSEK